MAQENELSGPLARDEAAISASTVSARKFCKHKPSNLSKLHKTATSQSIAPMSATQERSLIDSKQTESFIGDEEAMNIFDSISSKRGKPEAVIPMAKQLEALFNAGLITEKTAADYEEFEVPYDELPWVQRVKRTEEIEAEAAAESAKKLKHGGTKTASQPPKASSNKALPLSTWPFEQEDASLDTRSRTNLLKEGIDRSVVVDTSGYSPPVQPTAEDYHKSLKPTANNTSATGSKKDNAAAINLCALPAPPRRLHADVTASSMMGLHSTIVPRSLLEDDERARDVNSTDPRKAVSTEDDIDTYLAWRTRYYNNQTTLLNYNILVQTSAGLVPRDYDGRGLPDDEAMQTEALRAVDELLGRDEVLGRMDGDEDNVDPLVWVRTDAKKARKKTLPIVRRSQFNSKKQTLGIWRDGRDRPSSRTAHTGSGVSDGSQKTVKTQSSSPLQPTRRSARNAESHVAGASDTDATDKAVFHTREASLQTMPPTKPGHFKRSRELEVHDEDDIAVAETATEQNEKAPPRKARRTARRS